MRRYGELASWRSDECLGIVARNPTNEVDYVDSYYVIVFYKMAIGTEAERMY